MPNITFITTCKGRLDHIKLTLPTIISQQPSEIILVDYGCPQQAATWVENTFPLVKAVRVLDDPGFCVARARNIGAQHATSSWLFFIDGDINLKPGMLDWFSIHQDDHSFYRAAPINGERDKETWGSFVCRREAFERIGGYDEAFRGWGGEDDDIYTRLAMAGYREAEYPSNYVSAITHDDVLRTTYYDEKNKEAHALINRFYTIAKQDITRTSGKPMPIEYRVELMENIKSYIAKWRADGAHGPFSFSAEFSLGDWLPPPLKMIKQYKFTYYGIEKN